MSSINLRNKWVKIHVLKTPIESPNQIRRGSYFFFDIHATFQEKDLSPCFKYHNLYLNYAILEDKKIVGYMVNSTYICVKHLY